MLQLPKSCPLSDLKFFRQLQQTKTPFPILQSPLHMSLLNQQHSSSQLQQQVNNALSCLTIMETYTEIEPTQINQSQSILSKVDEPEDDGQLFLQNSQFKTTPFQASLSFIQSRDQYQKECNHKKQQPQQLSQDSSSSSQQEQIIKKTKLSPPRETLSILKRKKPAYTRTYNQHYKSRQDETVCSSHYSPHHNINNPFNRNNKSTFVRSDSQNKRYNQRFNKTRTDYDENHGNGYGGGYQRTENRYEAKREETYQHPHRNEPYYHQPHQQPQQNQPQPNIEGNGYITNGENTYWNSYYPVQQLDWAQWNWYNRMKYYEYINTAHPTFPPQFQGFYPTPAVNFAIPTTVIAQPKTIETHYQSASKPKQALSPEKRGKVCSPKFQMTINQCQLTIACSKSTIPDILMIPYSINEPSLYPHLKHQDYWITRDKVDKIFTQSKTRNGDVTFLATDRSETKTIAFLRVPCLKDETFQTSFNRGLLNLLTTAHLHGNSILIPYSFQFGSSKQKLTKIITFLQQEPSSLISLTIICQDMRSFRRMSEGASRCLSSLSQQSMIVY